MAQFNCFKTINVINPNGSINCLRNTLDFTVYDYVDLSFYGGDTHTVVNSEAELINEFSILGYEAVIKGCEITLLTLEEVEDVPTGQNPVITLDICNSCSDTLDLDLFDYVDLSPYGGDPNTPVYSIQDFLDQLTALLTTTSSTPAYATLTGCCITLVNYTGDPIDLNTYVLSELRPVNIVLECDDIICTTIGSDSYDILSIQNQPIDSVINIETSISATYSGFELCIDTQDSAYNASGAITYVYTNGVSEKTAIINYTVDSTQCDLCAVAQPSFITTIVNSTCGNDGSVSLNITQGYPPYSTEINGQTLTGSTPIFNLSEGTYPVVVTDSEGCSTSQAIVITSDTPLTCSTEVVNPTGCGTNNGVITVTASGGTPIYTYELDGVINNNGSFSSLMSGTYVINVTDANGCTTTCSAIIDVLETPNITANITGIDCTTLRREVTLSTTSVNVEYSTDNINWTSTNIYLTAGGIVATYYIRYADTPSCVNSVSLTIPAIVTGCNDPSSCDFDPNAECLDNCEECEAPLECINGACECPVDTYEFIKPNGDILCLPLCTDDVDCQLVCEDGSIAVSCTDCYCFDLFFALDTSGSMNNNGGLNAMKLAMEELTNYVADNYPGSFNFYIAEYNSSADEVVACTNITPTTAPGVISAVNSLTAGGSTSPSTAVNLINNNFSTCSSCDWQSLLVLTDGTFSSDFNSTSSAVTTFLDIGGDQVTGIALGTNANVNDLELISALDGTEDVYIAENSNLGGIMESIIDNLCISQCVTLNDGTQVCSPCTLGQTFNINTGECE